MDEVLQAIKDECEEGGQQLTLHAHAILSRVLIDVHKMQNQSNAEDLHPNMVFGKMDDDIPNSIKRLKDFYEKIWCNQINKKIGEGGTYLYLDSKFYCIWVAIIV